MTFASYLTTLVGQEVTLISRSQPEDTLHGILTAVGDDYVVVTTTTRVPVRGLDSWIDYAPASYISAFLISTFTGVRVDALLPGPVPTQGNAAVSQLAHT